MKKLLLITFLFLITPDAKADDGRCLVDGSKLGATMEQQISRCVKGDIIFMNQTAIYDLHLHISYWCDFDKTISYEKVGNTYTLTCVLNSTTSRVTRY